LSQESRRQQRGQILVLAVAVLSLLFVPLCVFLVDTALVEASYAQLGETLQAAAEDGAQMIDEGVYRQSGGQRVVLDQGAASATSLRALQVSGLPGLASETAVVRGNTVTISAQVKVQLMIVGSATIRQSRSASFAVGR
jgi:hypothetical protein